MITIAQGLFEEGRREGFLEGMLLELRQLGDKRFGPPSEQHLAALNALTDLDQLDRMADRLIDVHSWEELLQIA